MDVDQDLEAIKAEFRRQAALAAEFYEALVDLKLPTELCTALVRDWYAGLVEEESD